MDSFEITQVLHETYKDVIKFLEKSDKFGKKKNVDHPTGLSKISTLEDKLYEDMRSLHTYHIKDKELLTVNREENNDEEEKSPKISSCEETAIHQGYDAKESSTPKHCQQMTGLMDDDSGGEVFCSDVKLKIPAGAIPRGETMEISLSVHRYEDEYPPLDMLEGNGFAIAPVVRCEPSGTQFLKPVQLTLPHSAKNITEKNLTVWTNQGNTWKMMFNGSRKEEASEGTEIVVNEHNIKLELNHFSWYTAILSYFVGDPMIKMEMDVYMVPRDIKYVDTVLIYVVFSRKYQEEIVDEMHRIGGEQCAVKVPITLKLYGGEGLLIELNLLNDEEWDSAKVSQEIPYSRLQVGGLQGRSEFVFKKKSRNVKHILGTINVFQDDEQLNIGDVHFSSTMVRGSMTGFLGDTGAGSRTHARRSSAGANPDVVASDADQKTEIMSREILSTGTERNHLKELLLLLKYHIEVIHGLSRDGILTVYSKFSGDEQMTEILDTMKQLARLLEPLFPEIGAPRSLHSLAKDEYAGSITESKQQSIAFESHTKSALAIGGAIGGPRTSQQSGDKKKPRVNSKVEEFLEDFGRQIESRDPPTERTDLVYRNSTFAAKYFDIMGGVLQIKKADVKLYVPPGALKKESLVYLYLDPDNQDVSDNPSDSDSSDILVAPVVTCGPEGMKFDKKVTLTIPHCSADDAFDDDIKPITRGSENKAWCEMADDKVETSVKNGKATLKISHFSDYSWKALRERWNRRTRRTVRVAPFGPDYTQGEDIYQFRVWIYTNPATEPIIQAIEEKDLKRQVHLLEVGKLLTLHKDDERRGVSVTVEDIKPGWKLQDGYMQEQQIAFGEVWKNKQSCRTIELIKEGGMERLHCTVKARQRDDEIVPLCITPRIAQNALMTRPNTGSVEQDLFGNLPVEFPQELFNCLCASLDRTQDTHSPHDWRVMVDVIECQLSEVDLIDNIQNKQKSPTAFILCHLCLQRDFSSAEEIAECLLQIFTDKGLDGVKHTVEDWIERNGSLE